MLPEIVQSPSSIEVGSDHFATPLASDFKIKPSIGMAPMTVSFYLIIDDDDKIIYDSNDQQIAEIQIDDEL